MLRALLRRMFGCRHRQMYRERRPIGDVLVMHLVCEACGTAVPAMRRSTDDYRWIAAQEAAAARARRQVLRAGHHVEVVRFPGRTRHDDVLSSKF